MTTFKNIIWIINNLRNIPTYNRKLLRFKLIINFKLTQENINILKILKNKLLNLKCFYDQHFPHNQI